MNKPSNIKLFKAIETYKQAVYGLGKAMLVVKQSQGRKAIAEVTTFDIHRINVLIWLAELTKEHGEDLLPEALIEFYNADKDKVKAIFKNNTVATLKATEIRKLVRKAVQNVKSKDKPIKVNGFMRNLILLQNDVKGMDSATKQRALAQIVNTITELK